MAERYTSRSVLEVGTRQLVSASIDNAANEARLLLEHVSGWSHAQLVSRLTDDIPPELAEQYFKFIERRVGREPLHRITGNREFYGREFELSAETLIPRCDTEILVNVTLKAIRELKRPARLLDLGTGSGVIAVTLACEVPSLQVVASDISQQALVTAGKNANRHDVGSRVSCIHSDVFNQIEGTFDVIVSNPPYIPSSDIPDLQVEVRKHDPLRALDGGLDGLDFYRRIFAGCGDHLKAGGMLILEFGIGQAEDLGTLAGAHGFGGVSITRDLSGIERVMVASKIDVL